jgi:hypothetical protein
MSLPCPVCDKDGFNSRTAQLNHIRLTQDEEHQEFYRRMNEKVDQEDQEDEEDEEDERPKLEESFTDEVNGDLSTDKEEDSDMNVKELTSGTDNNTENPDYVKITDADLEKLVENGVAGDRSEATNLLMSAKKQGFTQVNPENGDLK